jgi:hypothetical protein
MGATTNDKDDHNRRTDAGREGYNEDVFIATLPDTNQDDGRYARIGISPGIGDRALVFADHMGANVFTAPRLGCLSA